MISSSLNVKDELEFSNGKIMMPMASSKLIGIVDVDEYDIYGRKIFSSRNKNDITLSGSVFMLEQLFKCKADDGKRFNYPVNKLPISYKSELDKEYIFNNPTTNININNQRIFGFMVGNAGEAGGNVIAPEYKNSKLNGMMPFRIIPSSDTKIDRSAYTFKATYNGSDYYYVKKFSEDPTINIKWADGSGDVNKDEIESSVNTPIVTYAQCILDISATDIRDYYTEMYRDQCMVNQIGLVAGEPILDDDGKETGEFKDIKLLSCVNFKSRDLSNTENTLKITYKIYCL